MSDKIELFKYILKKNELNRSRFNSYQNAVYASKCKNKNIIERWEKYDADLAALQDYVRDNRKRRRELQKELNTRQFQNGVNKIYLIRLGDTAYYLSDMKRVVKVYEDDQEINQILLGEVHE